MQPRLKIIMLWHETGELPGDQDVFEKLMAAASAMYTQTDRVSQALQVKTPRNGAFRKFEVKQSSNNRVYIELIDVEELPFNVPQVSSFVQSLSNRVKTSIVHMDNKVSAIPSYIVLSYELRLALTVKLCE